MDDLSARIAACRSSGDADAAAAFMERVAEELAAAASRADAAEAREAALRAVLSAAGDENVLVSAEQDGWLVHAGGPGPGFGEPRPPWDRCAIIPPNAVLCRDAPPAQGRAGVVWPRRRRPPWFAQLFDEDTQVVVTHPRGRVYVACPALAAVAREAARALYERYLLPDETVRAFALPAWADVSLQTDEDWPWTAHVRWPALLDAACMRASGGRQAR
jgi:hypothetical protein